MPPLFRRRTVWLPTLFGTLLWIAVATIVVVVAMRGAGGYLRVNEPAHGRDGRGARLLVVEGWLDEDELGDAIAAFRRGGYERVVTSGGPIDGWHEGQSATNFAERAAGYLTRHGLADAPVAAASAPASAQDRTFLSAVVVRDWIRREGLTPDAIDVYSAGVHARRSRLVYRLAFGAPVEIGMLAATPRTLRPRALVAHEPGHEGSARRNAEPGLDRVLLLAAAARLARGALGPAARATLKQFTPFAGAAVQEQVTTCSGEPPCRPAASFSPSSPPPRSRLRLAAGAGGRLDRRRPDRRPQPQRAALDLALSRRELGRRPAGRPLRRAPDQPLVAAACWSCSRSTASTPSAATRPRSARPATCSRRGSRPRSPAGARAITEAAAFYFTALPDSYAARTDRPDNVGVIGAAVFRERVPQPVQRPYETRRRWRAAGTITARLAASPSGARRRTAAGRRRGDRAPPSPAPPAARRRRAARARRIRQGRQARHRPRRARVFADDADRLRARERAAVGDRPGALRQLCQPGRERRHRSAAPTYAVPDPFPGFAPDPR